MTQKEEAEEEAMAGEQTKRRTYLMPQLLKEANYAAKQKHEEAPATHKEAGGTTKKKAEKRMCLLAADGSSAASCLRLQLRTMDDFQKNVQRRVAAGERVPPDVLRAAKLMDQERQEDTAASDSVGSGMATSAPPAKARPLCHGCSYCGQLGHRKTNCPRAHQDAVDEMWLQCKGQVIGGP